MDWRYEGNGLWKLITPTPPPLPPLELFWMSCLITSVPSNPHLQMVKYAGWAHSSVTTCKGAVMSACIHFFLLCRSRCCEIRFFKTAVLVFCDLLLRSLNQLTLRYIDSKFPLRVFPMRKSLNGVPSLAHPSHFVFAALQRSPWVLRQASLPKI